MRRIIRQPEVKAQNTALNNILLGIYYRHEFARRNEELIAASKTILGTLGIPLEQAEHFISPDGKTNMAKAIIDRVKAEPDGSCSQLMDQVASFFGEHRVLPMRCTSGTFFPKLKVSEFKLAFGIWGELMNLETFALARQPIGKMRLRCGCGFQGSEDIGFSNFVPFGIGLNQAKLSTGQHCTDAR